MALNGQKATDKKHKSIVSARRGSDRYKREFSAREWERREKWKWRKINWTYQSFYSFMVGCQLRNIWNIQWILHQNLFCVVVVVVVFIVLSSKKNTIFPSALLMTGWPDIHRFIHNRMQQFFVRHFQFECIPNDAFEAYIRFVWHGVDPVIAEPNIPFESGFISRSTVSRRCLVTATKWIDVALSVTNQWHLTADGPCHVRRWDLFAHFITYYCCCCCMWQLVCVWDPFPKYAHRMTSDASDSAVSVIDEIDWKL